MKTRVCLKYSVNGCSSNVKKIIIFSQKKAFLYFFKRKLFLYSRKRNPALFSPSPKNKKIHPEKIFYTLGNGNRDKCLMFQETETL